MSEKYKTRQYLIEEREAFEEALGQILDVAQGDGDLDKIEELAADALGIELDSDEDDND